MVNSFAERRRPQHALAQYSHNHAAGPPSSLMINSNKQPLYEDQNDPMELLLITLMHSFPLSSINHHFQKVVGNHDNHQ